ncbi:MAG: four helix bundle protein [Planctomycetes bacterium]|nr:four helix bundle protein [Planctomycetota bacterium]
MDPIKSFRDLKAWQVAKQAVREVYRLTESFPAKEQFGLTSQMRRAAVSIPANVAEGKGRVRKGDYLQFLSIARGSLAELETLLELSVELGFAKADPARDLWKMLQEVGRLLSGLIRAVSRDGVKDTRGPTKRPSASSGPKT